MSRRAITIDMDDQEDNAKEINVLIKALENALSVGEEEEAIQHVKLLTNLLKRYNNDNNVAGNMTKKLKLSISMDEDVEDLTMELNDCNKVASIYVPYCKPIHYLTSGKEETQAAEIKKLALKTLNVDEGLLQWQLGRFKVIKDKENIFNDDDRDDDPIILYPFPVNSDLKNSTNDLEMAEHGMRYELRNTKAREMRITTRKKVANSIDLTSSSSVAKNSKKKIGEPGTSGTNQSSGTTISDECIVIDDDDINEQLLAPGEVNHINGRNDNNNNNNNDDQLKLSLSNVIVDDILVQSGPSNSCQENQSGNVISTNEYNELRKLEECEIVPNFDAFECPICFIIIHPMEGIKLRECLHEFCSECLKTTVKMSTEVAIKCPYKDNEYSCEATVQEREIKALLSSEEYEKHLEKSIIQAENSAGLNQKFHCQTVNCKGWCFCDEDANNFVCPICEKINCLACRAIHETITCFEYQDNLMVSKSTDEQARRTAEKLKIMLQNGEAMHCPVCGIVLQKKEGCDFFKCTMCSTGICWATKQARWGPGGVGDNSGGCRCKVNGIKCHPSCTNCH